MKQLAGKTIGGRHIRDHIRDHSRDRGRHHSRWSHFRSPVFSSPRAHNRDVSLRILAMRSRTAGRLDMDVLFILLIAVLYAATDLLVRAVSRLGDLE